MADAALAAGPASAAVLLAVIAVAAIGHSPGSVPATADVLIPRTGYYIGVSEANETNSYRPVDAFAAAIGRQPNVVLV